MVLMHDTLSGRAFQMGEVSSKYLNEIFSRYRADKIFIICENNEREIPGEILKSDLWFLCMTIRLMELFKCVKFYQNI